MRILIVEDDRELCSALKLQLSAKKHTVHCCHAGARRTGHPESHPPESHQHTHHPDNCTEFCRRPDCRPGLRGRRLSGKTLRHRGAPCAYPRPLQKAPCIFRPDLSILSGYPVRYGGQDSDLQRKRATPFQTKGSPHGILLTQSGKDPDKGTDLPACLGFGKRRRRRQS